MPNHHEEIEKDQYEKINGLTARVEGLVAAVDISNQINIEMLKQLRDQRDSFERMTHRVLWGAFAIILVLLAALIFGAIGKDGLFAVRDSMPKVALAAPWHNDLDKYQQRRAAA